MLVRSGAAMSVHRYAAKRDENEPDIIKALRAHGCVVWQLSGKGIPDLLVLQKGKKWLADVKMPGKPTTKPQEDAWEEAATKARCSVFILRTPEDAARMLNNALHPWEPAPPEVVFCIAMGCGEYPRHGTLHCARHAPRKGDAAKRRKTPALKVYQHCSVNGCERGERCGKVVATSTGMGHAIRPLSESYTPPRSKPVDAAKEAEGTFAPASAPSCHADSDGDCGWAQCPQEANNRANYQSWCPLAAKRTADDD